MGIEPHIPVNPRNGRREIPYDIMRTAIEEFFP